MSNRKIIAIISGVSLSEVVAVRGDTGLGSRGFGAGGCRIESGEDGCSGGYITTRAVALLVAGVGGGA